MIAAGSLPLSQGLAEFATYRRAMAIAIRFVGSQSTLRDSHVLSFKKSEFLIASVD